MGYLRFTKKSMKVLGVRNVHLHIVLVRLCFLHNKKGKNGRLFNKSSGLLVSCGWRD